MARLAHNACSPYSQKYVGYLSALKTLKLFISPKSITRRHSIDMKGDSEELRLKCEMQKFADSLFGHFQYACPRLKVLVLEARGGRDDCMAPGLRYCYVRGAHAEFSGRLVPIGVPIEEYLIDIHEPCSDILEEPLRFWNRDYLTSTRRERDWFEL